MLVSYLSHRVEQSLFSFHNEFRLLFWKFGKQWRCLLVLAFLFSPNSLQWWNFASSCFSLFFFSFSRDLPFLPVALFFFIFGNVLKISFTVSSSTRSSLSGFAFYCIVSRWPGSSFMFNSSSKYSFLLPGMSSVSIRGASWFLHWTVFEFVPYLVLLTSCSNILYNNSRKTCFSVFSPNLFKYLLNFNFRNHASVYNIYMFCVRKQHNIVSSRISLMRRSEPTVLMWLSSSKT